METIGSGRQLSIIIPYFKTYELTCKLLDTLVPQLNDKVEVFLIDDGCHEERLDVYKAINIIHLEENKGACVAMNTGIKKAKGKYIAIVDSDDLVTEDYVETLLKCIDEHNEDVMYMDWKDMNTGRIVHRPNNYAQWKAIYKKEIIPLCREGWWYSYDVPFQEDLEKQNPTKYYIDKVLYIYNSGREGSLTLEKKAIIEGRK